jgi:hypothetical protein
MDFITDLPPSRWRGEVYDAILVIVCRYTKLGLYVPAKKTLSAEALADIFVSIVIPRLGAPSSIVSDRGSLFTSGFWREFCHELGIKRRLTTAFHLQTDGQTERLNQVIEHYLRTFVNYRQDNWAELLPVAEFAYNNSTHSSTGFAPFYALMGYYPRIPTDDDCEPTATNEAVAQRLHRMKNERKLVLQHLQQAVETQAKYYNQHHQPFEFTVGDKFLLSTKKLENLASKQEIE